MISCVFVSSSLQLRFVAQGISIMSKNEMIVVDNVIGIGEVAYDVNMNLASSSLNVENVHP